MIHVRVPFSLMTKHITRNAYNEKRILREAHERIYNYVRHNSHIYTSEILVVSTHATTRVASYFYFYFLRKYYHTHEYGGVLDNTYSSQILHTNEDRVVLGAPIQYSQREIPLRESRMRLPL